MSAGSVASSGDKPKTGILRYPGDVTGSLPAVIGGRHMVIEKRYDADLNVTLVEVAPLVSPAQMLERLVGGDS